MGEACQVFFSRKLERMQPATSHFQPTVAQRKCGPVLPDHLIFFFPRKGRIMKTLFDEIFECLCVINQLKNL